MTRTCPGCGEVIKASESRLELRRIEGGLQGSNCYHDVLCWDAAEMRANIEVLQILQQFAVLGEGSSEPSEGDHGVVAAVA